MSRLQLLQNSLARSVARTPKTITPVLKSLHWLKISLTYDFLHTSQFQYLRNLINIKPAAPLVLSIISLYFVLPPPLLLKYLIVHTTKLLLSSGIIYQNL